MQRRDSLVSLARNLTSKTWGNKVVYLDQFLHKYLSEKMSAGENKSGVGENQAKIIIGSIASVILLSLL